MQAQNVLVIGHIFGGRIQFGQYIFGQIVIFYSGTGKFTDTVMILDEINSMFIYFVLIIWYW